MESDLRKSIERAALQVLGPSTFPLGPGGVWERMDDAMAARFSSTTVAAVLDGLVDSGRLNRTNGKYEIARRINYERR